MTKAMSRAERRRRQKAARKAPQQATGASPQREAASDRVAVAPTPHRLQHGRIIAPEKDKPAIALDPLGQLLADKHITEAQEKAARTYQHLGFQARASMGIGGTGGGDGGGSGKGEGNAQVEKEWKEVRGILFAPYRFYLDRLALENQSINLAKGLHPVRHCMDVLRNHWG